MQAIFEIRGQKYKNYADITKKASLRSLRLGG
jgi:hypothetical protein